jgi:YaiO family outer membrane protein
MKKIILLILCILVFFNSVFAQDEEEKKYEVQFNFNTESLSRGLGTWRTGSLYVQKKMRNKQILWGNYRLSDRNSIRDQEFIVGTYKPLKNEWAFSIEAMASPTKKYVGKFSVMAEVEKGFKKGWVGHIGAKHTTYTTVKANTGYGSIEKYWGNNRAAYTLYVTKLSNAGTAPNHRIQYNRYYGENVNSFGVAVSFGREHENLGPNLGVLRSKTWSFSFSERHWFTKKFGINFDATIHRQGNLYYRRGVNVGVRYRF